MINMILPFQLIGEGLLAQQDSLVSSSELSIENAAGGSPLSVLLIINIVVLAVTFIFDLVKGRKENINYRIRKISETSILREKEIYDGLLELAVFDSQDPHRMLDKIMEVEKNMKLNKLYIGKAFFKLAEEFMDYFKQVLCDFRMKDVKKEEQLFEKLCREFYGQ